MSLKYDEELLKCIAKTSKFGDGNIYYCDEILENPRSKSKKDKKHQKEFSHHSLQQKETEPEIERSSKCDITFSHRQEQLREIGSGSNRNESIENYLKKKGRELANHKPIYKKNISTRKTENRLNQNKKSNSSSRMKRLPENFRSTSMRSDVDLVTKGMKKLGDDSITEDKLSVSTRSSPESIYYDCDLTNNLSINKKKYQHKTSIRRLSSSGSSDSSVTYKSDVFSQFTLKDTSVKSSKLSVDENLFVTCPTSTENYQYDESKFPPLYK